ncbi:MAG: hypothetical protein R3F61_28925 [Myxococcota bacterium]
MTLNDALDAVDGAGTAEVPREGGRAEVDVADVDRLGVRVRRVRVERDADWDVSEQARALPERLRALPERVEPSEVSPELGGAILRTAPRDYDGERYFEVNVGPRSAEVRRVKVTNGERADDDFTITREQLGRLIDELEG